MLPYLIVFGLFAVQAVRTGFNPATASNKWLIAAGAILVVMIGLRREVGSDWWPYIFIFREIQAMNLIEALQRIEPGYALLNWIAASLGWELWFPNLICAAIFVWGLIAFCRQQPNPSLALLVAFAYLVTVVAMGYTRQSVSLGFELIAITQLMKGNLVRLALSTGLAILFHTSAIVLAPIFAVALARRGLGPIILLGLLTAMLAYQSLGGVLQLFSRYTELTITSSGAVPRLLMNLFPALIFFTFPRRLTLNDVELRLWTIISLLVILSVALLFFFASSTIVDRVGLYFIPLQIFVLSRLPTVLGTPSRPSALVLTAVIVYSFLTQIVWLQFGAMSRYWIPYKNYLWDSGPDRPPPRWYREIS